MLDMYEKFVEFHHKNPLIYELFEKYAFQIIASGKDHYGSAAVFEQIRWYCDIITDSDEEFKLSNNHKTFYPRLFMHNNPEHKGFFRTKRIQDEELMSFNLDRTSNDIEREIVVLNHECDYDNEPEKVERIRGLLDELEAVDPDHEFFK